MKISVEIWKFVAKSLVGESSWHHTSKFFNKTNHYDLEAIAEYILNNEKKVLSEFGESKKDKFTFAVMKYKLWGGSRNYPKLLGEVVEAGIVKNEWFHTSTSKHNINGNKVIFIRYFTDFADLKKEYPQFSHLKQELLKIKDKK